MRNKKGYFLLECIVVMTLLTTISALSFLSLPIFSLEAYFFEQKYILGQVEAISFHKEIYVGEGVSFNKKGNVNQGRTLIFPPKKMIILLGNGSYRYE